MSKIQINNEIVLMRKNVTQAQVHIIKKLTRDAFKLRQKKGTEKEKIKNVRKADRIVAEILALKKVKKDEIIKNALENTLTLKEVLENRESKSLDKIIARVIHHPKFSQKIAEFKAKYPNFQEFLGPGRRKKAKLELKEKKKLLKKEKTIENGSVNVDTEIEKSIDINTSDEPESPADGKKVETENDESEEEKQITIDVIPEKKSKAKLLKKHQSLVKTDDSINQQKKDDIINQPKKDILGNKNKKMTDTISKVKKNENNMKKMNKKSTSKVNEEKLEVEENKEENATEPKTKISNQEIKIISKEAIVKNLEDFLKAYSKSNENQEISIDSIDDQESVVNPNVRTKLDVNLKAVQEENIEKSAADVDKEVDPFFMTGNGEANYMSVASLKKNSEDTEQDEDDHFNKFNRNKRKYQNDQDQNYSFNKNSKFRNFGQSDSKFNNQYKNNSKLDFNNRPNSRWKNQQSSDNFNRRGDTANYKPFNESRNNKSTFKKQEQFKMEEKNEKNLHPSWEAKKKQQSILKQGFQGKKIVFDD